MAHQTIVIGAGLAGLSAAYELVGAGCDVQVFEARQRLGGRVHTVQLAAGQYGEGGGEFVDDNHTAAIAYAAEFDLKLDPACQFPDALYWFIDGKLCNQKSFTTEQGEAVEDFDNKVAKQLEQNPDPPQTLAEWLDAHEIAPFARRVASVQAQALFAADAGEIGLGFFAQFSGSDGRNMRIRGGSSCLVNALAQHLGQVHTNNPVRRIQQIDNTVTVSVETASGLVEVVTDSVIVTIPWSVLRHIPIEAPLTDIQREAISSLPYGGLVKTLLQYPHRFWSQPNFGINLLEDKYQAIWEPTFAQPGTEKILSCFSGGNSSLLLAQQAIEKAEQTVRKIYPDAPFAIATHCSDWNADEWAKGGYCYFAPGQLHRFNAHLILPAGRVFFAGEHTAPLEYRGYMEGAIRSGQSAAEQILTLINQSN